MTVVDTLFRQRVALCDLLHGRGLRHYAAEALDEAVAESEGGNPEFVDVIVARAAAWEFWAQRAEWGQIVWGERNNRCGRTEDEPPRAVQVRMNVGVGPMLRLTVEGPE